MKLVRFFHPFGSFNTGERAGLSDSEALRLVALGCCEVLPGKDPVVVKSQDIIARRLAAPIGEGGRDEPPVEAPVEELPPPAAVTVEPKAEPEPEPEKVEEEKPKARRRRRLMLKKDD